MEAIRAEDPTDPHRTVVGTVLWLVAAVAVLVGGILHLQIWNKDYKDLPSVVPGGWVVKVGFPVNAAVSVVVAAVLAGVAFGALSVLRRYVVPAALVLEVLSLAALIQSHRGTFLRYQEQEWDSDAKVVLVVEIGATVALVVAGFLPAYLKRRQETQRS